MSAPRTATPGLSWDNAQRRPWSAELLRAVEARRGRLEAGNPDGFIAGYGGLADVDKTRFWAELVIAMARFESSWNPHTIYHEPPPLGVDSVGLLQLSYEDAAYYDLEPLSREAKSLEDPLVNLRCGVEILAHLLTRDRVVATGRRSRSRGGARYWSVLQEPPGHHRAEIRTHTAEALGL